MLIMNETWEGLAAQANYRPGALAKLCKVSLRTLQRHFAKNYSLTLGGWMRDVRVAQAYRRIAAGEQIKAVAFDLGFKQLSHFSRVFKQVHGVPPRMVRKPSKSAETAPTPTPTPSVQLMPQEASAEKPPFTVLPIEGRPSEQDDFPVAAAGLN